MEHSSVYNIQSVNMLKVDVYEVCSSSRFLSSADSLRSAAGNGSDDAVLGSLIVITLTSEARILVHSQ